MATIVAANHRVMGKTERKPVSPRYVAKVLQKAYNWGFDVHQIDECTIGVARSEFQSSHDLIFYVDEDSNSVYDFQIDDIVVPAAGYPDIVRYVDKDCVHGIGGVYPISIVNHWVVT